jgi:hypothetical protein
VLPGPGQLGDRRIGEVGADRRGGGHPQPKHQQWRHQHPAAHPGQTDEQADDQAVDRQQPVSSHPLPSSRPAWQARRLLAATDQSPPSRLPLHDATERARAAMLAAYVCRVLGRRGDDEAQVPRSRATVAPSPP